jgi:hypothetical protein
VSEEWAYFHCRFSLRTVNLLLPPGSAGIDPVVLNIRFVGRVLLRLSADVRTEAQKLACAATD